MIKVLNIIGARPQIIKAAAISRAIKTHFSEIIEEVIIHTGQHYDDNMSEVFFREMDIPPPKLNLEIGSASHAVQTAEMMLGMEKNIIAEKPDLMIAYGDTNSTLAAAIVACKLHLPIVHIEAGMRSFNKSMPEEVNRIMCDHVSSLLFTPTLTGYNNLIREGFSGENKRPYTLDNPGIFHSGDIMYDNSLYYMNRIPVAGRLLKSHGIQGEDFVLMTLHRPDNTDHSERISLIFNVVDQISEKEQIPFIIPLHPRTAGLLKEKLDNKTAIRIKENKLIKIIKPVSYMEMLGLERHAMMIFTDSGGVQKEAYFFKKPCIILRRETEWIELVENRTAVITDTHPEKILDAFRQFRDSKDLEFPPLFGDGHAAEFICREIIENFRTNV